MLPAITLSGIFETTRQDSLLKHSGLLQVDIDLKTPEDREQFYEQYRHKLSDDPYMVAVFDSPSFGVKGIFHMGVCKDEDEHKQMGLAVLEYLKQTYGIEERLLDTSTLDLGRKFSVSYDPKAYTNWQAEDFSQSDLVTELLENIKHALFTRSRRQSQTNTEMEGFSSIKNKQRIAQKLLERACQKIRDSAKGQRFETRRKQAYTMGGYHFYFDGNEALQALINATQGNCTSIEKAKRDVQSVYSAGQQYPLTIEEKTKEEKATFEKEMTQIMIDAEAAMQKNVTERWKADLEHGNWLTRSVRPLVLIFLIISTVILVFIDSGSIKFAVDEKWTDLLQLVLMTTIGAYFGGRSVEKFKKNK